MVWSCQKAVLGSNPNATQKFEADNLKALKFVTRACAPCKKSKLIKYGGAAIAQWIRLRLHSCHPWFESIAHHLRFII